MPPTSVRGAQSTQTAVSEWAVGERPRKADWEQEFSKQFSSRRVEGSTVRVEGRPPEPSLFVLSVTFLWITWVWKEGSKMVRSLAQWTKTLSFPARISPNKSSKDGVNIHQVSPTITPTLSNNSLSKNNEINTMMNNNHSSLTEVNQVSETEWSILWFRWKYI